MPARLHLPIHDQQINKKKSAAGGDPAAVLLIQLNAANADAYCISAIMAASCSLAKMVRASRVLWVSAPCIISLKALVTASRTAV